MTDDKILEAMAKALHAAWAKREYYACRGFHQGWQHCSEEYKVQWLEDAHAALTAYRAVSDDAKDVGGCFWWEDGEMWESSCGAAYQFTDGGPMDNDHKYCHLCGRHIEIQTDPIDAAMAKESEGE